MVPEYAQGLSEDAVCDHFFALVFSFDEVISPGGYNEHLTLENVRTHMVRMREGRAQHAGVLIPLRAQWQSMESHEEKLSQMIRASREHEAQVRATAYLVRASACRPRNGLSHRRSCVAGPRKSQSDRKWRLAWQRRGCRRLRPAPCRASTAP